MIKRIRIQNFKSIRDQTVDLEKSCSEFRSRRPNWASWQL